MATSNIMCQKCNQPASMGCLCEDPPVTICMGCLETHVLKPIKLPAKHLMKPLTHLYPSHPASPPPAPFISPEVEAIWRNGLPLVSPFPAQGPQPSQNLHPPIQVLPPSQNTFVPVQPTNPIVPPQAFKPGQSVPKSGPPMPVLIPLPPQNQLASIQPPVAPLEEEKSPPKAPGPKPKPAPLRVEEIKEVRPNQKKQGRKQIDPGRSLPESPKGQKHPPNSQLFPDKSQPPSPKRLKDPCPSCDRAESTVVITSNGDHPQKACDECAKDYPDVLPLATFPQLTSRDVINFAVNKYKNVKIVKKRIEENLNRIDTFKAKAEKEFEAASKELQNCKTRIFDKVTTLRREIESKHTTALAEIEANLCSRDFNPRTEYALVMWKWRVDDIQWVEDVNFDLFVSRCSAPDIVGEVTRTIDYEVNGLLALNCIPVITDNQIVKFNCKREYWCPSIPLLSEIHVSVHSAFTHIGEQDVLCTGGCTGGGPDESALIASNTAFIVNTATGSTTSLKLMATARYHHGSIWIGQNVFMFGGQNQDYLSVCEKLCLNHQDQPWSQLREMLSPRACFNPLVKEKLIYLMGGSNTRDCELYDFTRNTFKPLSFFLPASFPVCAVLLLPNICIFQNSKGLIWDPLQKSTKHTIVTRDLPSSNLEREEQKPIDVWSNFSPLIVAGRLYLSCNQTKEVVRQELGGRYGVHSFPFPKLPSSA